MNNNRTFRAPTAAIALAALLFLAACGDDDDAVASVSEPAATEEAVQSDEAEGAAEVPEASAAGDYAPFTEQDAIEAAVALEVAYNEFDEARYLAATAADYRFVDERGVTPRDVQVTFLPALRDLRQVAEATSDYVVTGDGPFIVAVDATIRNSSYEAEGRMGTSTYTIVAEDGVLRVAEHRWTGDPL